MGYHPLAAVSVGGGLLTPPPQGSSLGCLDLVICMGLNKYADGHPNGMWCQAVAVRRQIENRSIYLHACEHGHCRLIAGARWPLVSAGYDLQAGGGSTTPAAAAVTWGGSTPSPALPQQPAAATVPAQAEGAYYLPGRCCRFGGGLPLPQPP